MVVMDNDGDIFDERRIGQRRKNIQRRKDEKDILLDRRDQVVERRSGKDRRQKDINA